MSASEFAEPGRAHTPYMRARQEWDARMGNAVVQARNWRLATFVSLVAVVVSTGGAIYLGQQPKSVPYIIEIDKLGAAAFRGPLAEQASAFSPTEAQIQYHLRRFVQAVRSVSSDPKVITQVWQEAQAMCTARCGNMLSSYVKEGGGNPMLRVGHEIVTIEVISAVPIAGGAWQLDWREKTWDVNGTPDHEATWRGIFHTKMMPPISLAELRANPIGLFVDEFHWDKVGGA